MTFLPSLYSRPVVRGIPSRLLPYYTPQSRTISFSFTIIPTVHSSPFLQLNLFLLRVAALSNLTLSLHFAHFSVSFRPA